MQKNLLIDLNSNTCYFGVPTNKGASNEHGQNDFFSSHGIPATLRIPQMCCALPRRTRVKLTCLFEKKSSFGIRFSLERPSLHDKVSTLPLYMVEQMKRLAQEAERRIGGAVWTIYERP